MMAARIQAAFIFVPPSCDAGPGARELCLPASVDNKRQRKMDDL